MNNAERIINRIVTNGYVLDIGLLKIDGSLIVRVPGKALFKVCTTDGKITIDTDISNLGKLHIDNDILTFNNLTVNNDILNYKDLNICDTKLVYKSLNVSEKTLKLNDLIITDNDNSYNIVSTKPIHIDSPETKLFENNEDRVDKLRLEVSDILTEISNQMDTIIADSGSTADTTTINSMIDTLKTL